MPELSISGKSAAPPERVWRMLLSEDAYPEFIEDVLRVDVTPGDAGERVSSWAVSLDGAVLEWRQHERIDDAAYEMTFRQLDGDLRELSGRWAVRPDTAHGSVITLDLAFEIGIPLLADVLNPIAVRELGDGFQSILDALGEQSSQASEIATVPGE